MSEAHQMAPDTTVILSEIQRLENECHQVGMTVTAHALNHAKNALGWETAGETELAGMAARGERPGDK